MSKIIAIVLGFLLITTNIFWLYSALDSAVTKKYEEQMNYENEHQIKALSKLNNYFVNGMTKENLKSILQQLFPKFEPMEKEGFIGTMWLSFKVNSEGKVYMSSTNQ